MPRESVPSLGRLRLPAMHCHYGFTHAGRRYRLTSREPGWALYREDETALMATLIRTSRGWAVVPPGQEGEWHDAFHFLAVAAFLDDNDAWELERNNPAF